MQSLIMKFNDGGPFITYPILILLFIILGLFIQGLIRKNKRTKIKSLLASIGWFVLAWGFLGRTLGLIDAFDKIAAAGELTPRLVSEGLKMALIDPLFGLFTFLVARLGIILFIWMEKDETQVS